MSFIDESMARLFLQATPLRAAVIKTIDLDSIEKKIKQFETYAKSVWEKIVLENQDKSFLQEEIQWSLSQCNKSLGFLKKLKNLIGFKLKIVTELLKYL